MNTVVHEDCITGMKKLDAVSADIIICDPPYNIGKDFQNGSDRQAMSDYLTWCSEWMAEASRVLKPKGTMYIYGFSKILMHLGCRVELELGLNVEWIIWNYTNKCAPSRQFWQKTHESILVCSKDSKPHFNRDDVRIPYTEATIKQGGKKRAATGGRFGSKETVYVNHMGGALPRDVITIPALSGGSGKKERVNHPTQKPLALCQKLIRASRQKEGDTLVVIPFAGSGSECVASKMEGVNFIGYEITPDYVELCNARLASCESGDS